MNERLRLPTFVVGPEPDGRGSGLLAQSGLAGSAGWQGNLPLVLLEWAKLRMAEGFCGRFSVQGGAIAIRAGYFGEGSAGPIARAFGIFIQDDALPMVQGCEHSLFAAIPVPNSSDDFGAQPLDVMLQPDRAVTGFDRLGLAWTDRQIFAAAPQSLEEIALTALASITPAGQWARIKGWCTTAQLSARGDFLPIQRCSLLVTRPDEALAHERFVAARIDGDGLLDNAMVTPPANYQFWLQLRQMVGDQPGPLRDAVDWYADMSDWTNEELAWRFVEILSQHQAEYRVIVGAILHMGDLPGEGRQAVSAAIMRNYLFAVADHSRVKLPEVVELFRATGGAKRPEIINALDDATLALADEQLLAHIDDASLLRIIRLLRRQAEENAGGDIRTPLEMLDDQSVWRALGRNIRSPGIGEGERRVHLTAIRHHLGAMAAPDADYHKLFLRRKIVGHMLDNQGA